MKRPERWREGPRTAAWFLHTLSQRLPEGLRLPQDSHCHHRVYLSDPARLKSLHRPLAAGLLWRISVCCAPAHTHLSLVQWRSGCSGLNSAMDWASALSPPQLTPRVMGWGGGAWERMRWQKLSLWDGVGAFIQKALKGLLTHFHHQTSYSGRQLCATQRGPQQNLPPPPPARRGTLVSLFQPPAGGGTKPPPSPHHPQPAAESSLCYSQANSPRQQTFERNLEGPFQWNFTWTEHTAAIVKLAPSR